MVNGHYDPPPSCTRGFCIPLVIGSIHTSERFLGKAFLSASPHHFLRHYHSFDFHLSSILCFETFSCILSPNTDSPPLSSLFAVKWLTISGIVKRLSSLQLGRDWPRMTKHVKAWYLIQGCSRNPSLFWLIKTKANLTSMYFDVWASMDRKLNW